MGCAEQDRRLPRSPPTLCLSEPGSHPKSRPPDSWQLLVASPAPTAPLSPPGTLKFTSVASGLRPSTLA